MKISKGSPTRSSAATTVEDPRLKELGEMAAIGNESPLLGTDEAIASIKILDPSDASVSLKKIVETSYKDPRASRAVYRIVRVGADRSASVSLFRDAKILRGVQMAYKIPERGLVFRAADATADARITKLIANKKTALWLAGRAAKVPVEKLSAAQVIEQIHYYQLGEQIDQALALIFRWVDGDLKERRGEGVDVMLKEIDVSRLDEDLIVGLMTSTYAGKKLLRMRDDFALRAKQRLAFLIGKGEAAKLMADVL